MSLNNDPFRPCAVIPCYNHGKTVIDVVVTLMDLGLNCVIIDDGSDLETQQIIAAMGRQYLACHIINFTENQGKGSALCAGFHLAHQLGYSHALQVDADGQHDLTAVNTLLHMAKETPHSLISGQPIYDHSVPRSRLYGRYITHFWVWIETLSLALKDSMCGFRVYPLMETLALLSKHPIGQRMDFDTEIMVRLYWAGVNSRFLPTKVCYPEDGISHFDLVKDNIRISKMHIRLLIGMLLRLPKLLRHQPTVHWAKREEKQGLIGMRFMFSIYRTFGRKPFSFLLYFVMAWFWLSSGEQRRASRDYLKRLRARYRELGRATPVKLTSYRHFHHFGETMLDKIACWSGKLNWGHDIEFTPGSEAHLLAPSAGGKVILASHLGDVEVCRALAQLGKIRVINVLVFYKHAARFQQLMSENAPESMLNLISVDEITPDLAIRLQEKIMAGEWVAIVGDRVSIKSSQQNPRRIAYSPFLGELAPFPQGPFILASLLKCPVLLLFALKIERKIEIYCETFANPLLLPRADRKTALQSYIDKYAARLEYYTLLSPLDWFNFYPFWQLPTDTTPSEEK